MALPSNWQTFLAAIRAQESGGNYTQDSAGCLGAYCWNAQSNWDTMAADAGEKTYVGVNPSQVPAAIQDKVASWNLYRAYQQGGNSLDAAAMWWNGGTTHSEANPGLPAQSWAPHCGGGSSAAYACQVLARMGLGGHYLAGGGSGAGGVVTTAARGQADCLIGFGGIPGTSWINDIFGSGGNVGGFCLLTKSQGRAVLAVGVLASGAVILGFGLGLTLAFTKTGQRIMAVVSMVPGAGNLGRAAGAAGAAAGATASRPGQPLTEDEVKQARANRRKLTRMKREDDQAGEGDAA